MKKFKIFATLRESLEFIKNNNTVFIPSTIIAIIYYISFYWEYYEVSIENMALFSEFVVPSIFSMSIFLLNAVIVRIVADSRKRGFTLAKSSKAVLKRIVPILASVIALGVFAIAAIVATLFVAMSMTYIFSSTLGLALFAAVGLFGIVITFYMIIRLEFFLYAIILDKKRITDAFRKSWKITKGNVMSIFLVQMIFALVIFAVIFPIALVVMITFGDAGEPMVEIVNSIFYIFMMPLYFTTLTLIYKKIS